MCIYVYIHMFIYIYVCIFMYMFIYMSKFKNSVTFFNYQKRSTDLKLTYLYKSS